MRKISLSAEITTSRKACGPEIAADHRVLTEEHDVEVVTSGLGAVYPRGMNIRQRCRSLLVTYVLLPESKQPVEKDPQLLYMECHADQNDRIPASRKQHDLHKKKRRCRTYVEQEEKPLAAVM